MMQLKVDSIKRAQTFCEEMMREDAKVFHLLTEEGNIFGIDSNEPIDDENQEPVLVLPFWSPKYLPFAKTWAQGLEIKSMDFNEFYSRLIPGVIEQKCLLGINWDMHGCGLEKKGYEVLEMLIAYFRANHLQHS